MTLLRLSPMILHSSLPADPFFSTLLSGDPYDDRLTEDEMTKVVEQWSRG